MRITDGNGNVLANYAPPGVPFAVSRFAAQTLTPNVSARSLNILLATEWNNGVNGISFVSTPAIPEPESYAMLLAGLGLLRFVARRRKEQGV